jgi:hypothetical protein
MHLRLFLKISGRGKRKTTQETTGGWRAVISNTKLCNLVWNHSKASSSVTNYMMEHPYNKSPGLVHVARLAAHDLDSN